MTKQKNMKSTITAIIDLLKVDAFYNESDYIDIAKGRDKLPLTYKQMRNTIRRTKDYGSN